MEIIVERGTATQVIKAKTRGTAIREIMALVEPVVRAARGVQAEVQVTPMERQALEDNQVTPMEHRALEDNQVTRTERQALEGKQVVADPQEVQDHQAAVSAKYS